ncbi:unnamed protein product [Linum trigynum]|uniref:Uncharacterized protein n=1 Tax=Linum trigynum TaxID=586398 RepID=A0AAV2DZ31_9ROSI
MPSLSPSLSLPLPLSLSLGNNSPGWPRWDNGKMPSRIGASVGRMTTGKNMPPEKRTSRVGASVERMATGKNHAAGEKNRLSEWVPQQ